MKGNPVEEHIRELGALVGRLVRRVESRRREGKPTHVEEREIAAVRWAALECHDAQRLRAENAALKKALGGSDDAA